MCIFEEISQIYTLKKRALRPFKLLLPLFTSRALPIVRQVLEGYAVVLGGVIDVTADGADVLAGGLLLGEIHFGQDGWHGMVEVHHTLGLQVLVALRGPSMSRKSGTHRVVWHSGIHCKQCTPRASATVR